MRSYFAYCRVSTQKQGEKGVSLSEQRDAIVRYANANSLSISEWFEERETAAKGGRPIFTQMLARLRNQEVAGVIIHKIDRSARNLKDWADLGDLIDRGVDLHFAHESLDLTSRGGRLSADIQAIIAADYIRNLKSEVRKGIYGRLKQGLYPFAAPVGYLDQGGGKPKVPDPAKAPLIRLAFDLYANGTRSLRDLRDELEGRGLTNIRGGRLSINGLSQILNNPFYYGVIYLKSTGESFEGVHEPLISRCLFERARAMRTTKAGARTIKHEFVFRRALRCAQCRYALVGERQKGHVYYRCHTRNCPTTSVREERVEQKFADVFSSLQLDHGELVYLGSQLDVVKANWASNRAALANGARLNLQRLEHRLDRLTDAFVDSAIDKETYDRRRATLVADIHEGRRRTEALNDDGHATLRHVARFLEQLKTAQLSYESALPAEKRQMLRDVTSNRVLDGKNLVVELREPYATIANRPRVPGGPPQRNNSRTDDTLFNALLEHFNNSTPEREDRNYGIV